MALQEHGPLLVFHQLGFAGHHGPLGTLVGGFFHTVKHRNNTPWDEGTQIAGRGDFLFAFSTFSDRARVEGNATARSFFLLIETNFAGFKSFFFIHVHFSRLFSFFLFFHGRNLRRNHLLQRARHPSRTLHAELGMRRAACARTIRRLFLVSLVDAFSR